MNNSRVRILGSDDSGSLLAGFLNADDGSWGYAAEPHRRVKELVMELATLREKADQGILPSDEETARINAALKNYPWVLRVRYPQMVRRGKISRSPKPVFTDWQASHDEAQSFAVMAINLARAGHLERLRRCVRCHTWFFAGRNPRASHCSVACRQKTYRSKPGYDEKNKKYQRAHYWRLKELAGLTREKKRAKKR